jgi:hypothetical protein
MATMRTSGQNQSLSAEGKTRDSMWLRRAGVAGAVIGLGPLLSAFMSLPTSAPAASAAAPSAGYWLAGSDGGVYAFNAPFFGSGYGGPGPGACTFTPQAPSPLNGALGCSAIASTSTGNGYFLLNQFRGATPFGSATLTSNTCALPTDLASVSGGGPFLSIAATKSGNGVWGVDRLGGVEICGDAVSYGSNPFTKKPIVGIVPTPDGKGYWLVASDGGVFSYGDAQFYGSTGAIQLNEPIVGMATTPDGGGYWLVASDGGVFAFGDAIFAGSMGGKPLTAPMVGIAANPDGTGYWTVARDGGVFAFGDAPFRGSMGGQHLNAPVVGIAPKP